MSFPHNTPSQRSPEQFTQTQLASAITKLNGTLTAQNGCVTNYSTEPAESQCSQSSFKYPQNGEYVFYYDENSVDTCVACLAGYGCSYDNEIGPGAPCTCGGGGGGSINKGQKCAVQRVAFNGDIGACCMIAMSPGHINGQITTGWNKAGQSNPQFNNWAFLAYDTYTCSPQSTFDCSTAASNVASECSTFNRDGTYIAWNPNNKNKVPAYCYNYVNNVVSANNSASAEVLNAALNNLPANFDFGKNDTTGIQANALNNIINLCSTKGGCDKSLQNICSNKSYNDVLNAYKNYLDPNSTPLEKLISQNIYQACGCHLPPVQYESDGWSNLGVTETCDPICMIPGVVPQWSSAGPLQCSQNLCIINDVKIDIINSNAGNITFNEVCGGCGNNGGGCRCIFSGINVFQSGSTVGNLNFSQNCAGNCQIPDINNPGNFIPVNCSTGLPSGNTPIPINLTKWELIKKWANNNKFELLVIVIAIIIAIIILLVWLNKKNHLPKSNDLIDQITLSDLFKNHNY